MVLGSCATCLGSPTYIGIVEVRGQRPAEVSIGGECAGCLVWYEGGHKTEGQEFRVDQRRRRTKDGRELDWLAKCTEDQEKVKHV